MKNTRNGLMSQQVNRLSFAIIAGIVMGGLSILGLIIYFATGQFTETMNTIQSS